MPPVPDSKFNPGIPSKPLFWLCSSIALCFPAVQVRMSIFSKWFGRSPAASLDSIRFDTSRYHTRSYQPNRHDWRTEDDLVVSLYFSKKRPDLPRLPWTPQLLHDFFSAHLTMTGASLVDCDLATAANCPAVRLLIKSPRNPIGNSFLGSLTVPFRDFSYVIKVQAEEDGATGVREAVLLDEALSSGRVQMLGDKLITNGWTADDPAYDPKFPRHPLTLVRQELRRIIDSLSLQPTVLKAPGF
jgi:hypothetical protein